MKRYPLFLLCLALIPGLQAFAKNNGSETGDFRPPAVPLVAHDPYFSIWSPADRLYDAETVHWTGRPHSMQAMVRIDGKAYRLMGSRPSNIEPLPQASLIVDPTRTVYVFRNDKAVVTMSFTTPALPENLDIYSRPVTYIGWEVSSADGKTHQVQFYLDCSGELAVDQPGQTVRWEFRKLQGISAMKVGTIDQPILQKRGDDLRIDWGYAWLASNDDLKPSLSIGPGNPLRKTFAIEGRLPAPANELVRPVEQDNYSMALAWDLGQVGSKMEVCSAMLAYDDLFSIRYFDEYLPPYWRRNGMTMEQLLPLAAAERDALEQKCRKFDKELTNDLAKAGGEAYAKVTSLVYRECVAAHKVTAGRDGQPLLFSKENFSNGCIATVDVLYPASPFFLLLSPALSRAMMKPVLDYAASPRWKFPFAPHDLGTYPHATGQVYGGGELTEKDQMPVEETGNMLILLAALARAEGNAGFCKPYWPTLERWAKYLSDKGFDPENQLCTDDFAGHLAHNINLSAKAIVALASYAELCRMEGRKDEAAQYAAQSAGFAAKWKELATEGDHTRLAFDQPGTWSQKYNLVWDGLLNLNLFPKEIIQKEIDFYLKVQGPFGLPLDNRERWTKTDWILWTATMAPKEEDFQALFMPVYRFINATPQRVPVTDWYVVDNAWKVGFQARPVIGGLFIKALKDNQLHKKWFSRGARL